MTHDKRDQYATSIGSEETLYFVETAPFQKSQIELVGSCVICCGTIFRVGDDGEMVCVHCFTKKVGKK